MSVKQAIKAAQLSEEALKKNDPKPPRGLQSEEEILLLFDMLESKGDIATWKTALDSPLLDPRRLFQAGQKDLFLRTVSVFARFGEWQAVYTLVKDCLSWKDGDQLSLLASDWSVWERWVEAAAHVQDSNTK